MDKEGFWHSRRGVPPLGGGRWRGSASETPEANLQAINRLRLGDFSCPNVEAIADGNCEARGVTT